MRVFRVIFVFLLIFIFVLFAGRTVVLGAYEYTAAEIEANYDPATGGQIFTPNNGCLGCAGTDAGTYTNDMQDYAGFYEWPPDSGSYYAIGLPTTPEYGGGGGGGGPEDNGTGACTGVYANCWDWSACSPTCGPGTQERTCFDTGCGAPQAQSQACQVNDPNIWGPPTTCSVKCGGGTQDRINQCGTTETIACNTSACPAWTKLKDSSYVSTNPLYNLLSLTPVAYDADDTTDQYFIVGNDGVVAAPGIELDISNVTPTAKTGNPEYKVIYTPESYSLTPSSFLSYVRARKEYKVITDLGEITGSGIYVYSGDLAISSNVTPFNQSYKIVLIVSGTVTVSAAPDNTFTPTGTAAIVATTINFDSTITEAQGVFVGRTISTGTNGA